MASLGGVDCQKSVYPSDPGGVLETEFLKPKVQTLVALAALSLGVCAFLSRFGGSLCPCLSSPSRAPANTAVQKA